jgi:glycosyltransferase involved in cell wall biosynthesis
MRIVRVTGLLDFGGVEKRMVNVSTAVPAGTQLIFVVLGQGGRASAEIEANGCRVICLNQPLRIPNVLLIIKLARLFRQLKPDVVHASGAEANFHALPAAYLAGVKKRFGEEIGFPAHSAKARMMFRLVYRFCSKLVCISKAVAEKVVALKEVDELKTSVVYNPIVLSTVMPAADKMPGRFVFATVCRLTAVKNLQALLRVFAKLQKHSPNVFLYIAGDGPEMNSLVQLAAALGIKEHVCFTGFLPDAYTVLCKADVFILPSFSEGLGNAVMEAMLAGLPCIVSGVGGAAELVSPGYSGWLINPLSEDDIYAKMLEASTTSTLGLQQMGSQGSAFIKQNFSIGNHWHLLMKLYTA